MGVGEGKLCVGRWQMDAESSVGRITLVDAAYLLLLEDSKMQIGVGG